MKTLLTYLLLIFYILQGVSNIGIYISFKIYQDYISSVLCINKDTPEKKCNGKCHLNKELKKAENNKKESTPLIPEIKEQLQFFEIFFIDIVNFPERTDTGHSIHKRCCSLSNFTPNIFHPPKKLA